jgi:[ribosomal protein S18]-alanine N-acetyltransferase
VGVDEPEREKEIFGLRPATEDDLSPILEIETKVHLAPWSLENFRSELTKPYSRFLVLSDDDTDCRVAGYIVFWGLEDGFQILNLAVDLPFRGLGMGKRLVGQAIKEALRKGAQAITLEVRKSNRAAIQLYQGMGFAITQLRKGFYSNGEDAFVMSLDLSGKPAVEF